MTSTEIELRGNGYVAERDTVDGWLAVVSDVIKLANVIAPTDFVPSEYRDNPPAVAAAILAGRELGIGPMTSLRHVQVVKGTPTLSAEYKRARVLGAGHEFDILELNTQRCKVSGRRKGSNKPPLEILFTMDDARTAGLLAPSRSGKPGAWQTRPRRMLFARAGSELCDFLFADVVNGLPTMEVVADGLETDELPGHEAAAETAAPGKPAPRTARRRQPEPKPDPTAPAADNGQSTASSTARPAASRSPTGGTDLPPLPGEDEPEPAGGPQQDTGSSPPSSATGEPDETDYDTEGTVLPGQLTAMWATFTADLGFGKDDKAEARKVCEKIIGRRLLGGTTGNLSRNEASACIDTLKRVKTRERLIVLMNDGELPADDEQAAGND